MVKAMTARNNICTVQSYHTYSAVILRPPINGTDNDMAQDDLQVSLALPNVIVCASPVPCHRLSQLACGGLWLHPGLQISRPAWRSTDGLPSCLDQWVIPHGSQAIIHSFPCTARISAYTHACCIARSELHQRYRLRFAGESPLPLPLPAVSSTTRTSTWREARTTGCTPTGASTRAHALPAESPDLQPIVFGSRYWLRLAEGCWDCSGGFEYAHAR